MLVLALEEVPACNHWCFRIGVSFGVATIQITKDAGVIDFARNFAASAAISRKTGKTVVVKCGPLR